MTQPAFADPDAPPLIPRLAAIVTAATTNARTPEPPRLARHAAREARAAR